MSWKKNAFSYLMWFAYTVLTAVLLVSAGAAVCVRYGLTAYWSILIAALYAAIVCGITELLYRFSVGFSTAAGTKREHLLVLEALAVTVLLAVGIVLRMRGMTDIPQTSDYFEAAKVAEGQEIPQTVHGAVYFYIQMLHAVFMLFGNRYMTGIWVQAALQLTASVLLYFTVRKLSGSVAALVSFGFCMCAPYMIRNSLILSPNALYFCLFAAAVSLMAVKKSRLRPVVFLFMGLLSAFCIYIDITGILLLLLAWGIAAGHREEEHAGDKKILAVIFSLAGTVLGFACCIFLDSFFSGKAAQGVALAWLRLYQAEGFRLPVSMETGTSLENIALPGLMAFGIFSFWYDKEGERLSLYTVMAYCVIAACCFGVFTEEMPGFYCLYLILAVLAGTGLGQCFNAMRGEQAGGKKTDASHEAVSVENSENGAEKEKEEQKTAPGDKAGKKDREDTPGDRAGKKDREDAPGDRAGKKDREDTPGDRAGKKDREDTPKEKAERKDMTGEIEKNDLPEKTEEDTVPITKKEEKKRKQREREALKAEKKAQKQSAKEALKKEKDLKQGEKDTPKKEEETSKEKEDKTSKKGNGDAGKQAEGDIVIIDLTEPEDKKPIQYIENPLPLPKKHVKRKMDYPLQTVGGKDDFDYPVADDDDFDI